MRRLYFFHKVFLRTLLFPMLLLDEINWILKFAVLLRISYLVIALLRFCRAPLYFLRSIPFFCLNNGLDIRSIVSHIFGSDKDTGKLLSVSVGSVWIVLPCIKPTLPLSRKSWNVDCILMYLYMIPLCIIRRDLSWRVFILLLKVHVGIWEKISLEFHKGRS